ATSFARRSAEARRRPSRLLTKERRFPHRRLLKSATRRRRSLKFVSKRRAYTACRPSFARRRPALPQATCRSAPAQLYAGLHQHLSPSSAHHRKRKNTLRRRASAIIRRRSPASDVAHKPYAPYRAKRRSADE